MELYLKTVYGSLKTKQKPKPQIFLTKNYRKFCGILTSKQAFLDKTVVESQQVIGKSLESQWKVIGFVPLVLHKGCYRLKLQSFPHLRLADPSFYKYFQGTGCCSSAIICSFTKVAQFFCGYKLLYQEPTSEIFRNFEKICLH